MKQYSLWNKRIPTMLGFLLVISSIGILSFLANKGIIFTIGAAPSQIPQHVAISNVTDKSFTVTYTTEASTVGSLSLEGNKTLSQVILDDRDKQNNSPQSHIVHSFTITNLSPTTTYYFSITSGNTTYKNNKSFFSATTGPPLASSNALDKIISGTVILPQDNQEEVLVFLQLANSQLLSTVANHEGEYTFSLQNIRTNDLSQYEQIHVNDPAVIIVTDSNTSSHIVTEIRSVQTVPPVALSQDYNFIPVNSQTSQEGSTLTGFPAFATQLANTLTIPAITSPKHNETFTDQQPEFSGLAQPNAAVNIVIHSDASIQTQVTADNNGQWSFRPDTPLSVGNHTITITTSDTSGNMQSVTQTFSIFPIGTQVFQTATPSATLTPTNSPTPTIGSTPTPTQQLTSAPTPTLTNAPTPTLILIISPTMTPTNPLIPTVTPSSPPTPTPTQSNIPLPTRRPLPPTGNPFIFPIGIASILTTILGIGIFIF